MFIMPIMQIMLIICIFMMFIFWPVSCHYMVIFSILSLGCHYCVMVVDLHYFHVTVFMMSCFCCSASSHYLVIIWLCSLCVYDLQYDVMILALACYLHYIAIIWLCAWYCHYVVIMRSLWLMIFILWSISRHYFGYLIMSLLCLSLFC